MTTLNVRNSCYLLLFLLAVSFTGCTPDPPECEACPGLNTLQRYLEVNDDFTTDDQLIACAAGGQSVFLEDAARPLSVFYYPLPDAYEFRYFETETIDVDPSDFSHYKELGPERVELFNGFLHYFKRTEIDNERWAIVTYKVDNTIHYCNPIRLKLVTKPTLTAPTAEVTIAPLGSVEPEFTWTDAGTTDNFIYFQVISDQNDNVITATYTKDRQFKYYDVSNVVIKLTEDPTSTSLEPASLYKFTLMGVSEDNWVNLISQNVFFTN